MFKQAFQTVLDSPLGMDVEYIRGQTAYKIRGRFNAKSLMESDGTYMDTFGVSRSVKISEDSLPFYPSVKDTLKMENILYTIISVQRLTYGKLRLNITESRGHEF